MPRGGKRPSVGSQLLARREHLLPPTLVALTGKIRCFLRESGAVSRQVPHTCGPMSQQKQVVADSTAHCRKCMESTPECLPPTGGLNQWQSLLRANDQNRVWRAIPSCLLALDYGCLGPTTFRAGCYVGLTSLPPCWTLVTGP